jgi:Macrocin-O-methyltransferase (TylF)
MRLAASINSILRLADLRLMRASGYAQLQQLAAGTNNHDRASTVMKTDSAASRGLPPYREKCLEIFGRELARGDNALLWSFDYESPESEQLFTFMYGMKCSRLGKYIETIKSEGLEGAIVEFGVNDGGSLSHLVEKCEALGLRLPIFGFDSFEGLPEVSPHDLSCFQAGQFAAPVDAVAQKLKCHQRKHVHLVKGWFSETLATKEIMADPSLSRIAFAHVDCDLYGSAVDCLKFLERRLISGAFLIFDDWTFSESHGETKAFFEWFDKVRELYRFEDIAYLDRGSVHMRVWLR